MVNVPINRVNKININRLQLKGNKGSLTCVRFYRVSPKAHLKVSAKLHEIIIGSKTKQIDLHQGGFILYNLIIYCSYTHIALS